MNKIKIILVAVIALSGLSYYGVASHVNATSDAPQSSSLISVVQYERQATKNFTSKVVILHQDITRYCHTGNETNSSSIKMSWINAMHAWMPLQGQGKGPKQAIDLSWSIQFWPDKKNITGRKMEQLLQEPNLWQINSIKQQSVTVQGLGALEWLLFDPLSEFFQQDKPYCQLALSISDNLSNNALEIEKAWQVNPWQSLPATQWPAEYLGLMMNQLDFLIQKIQRPLAKIGQPRPYFSESWRAKQSFALMLSNIKALHQLYLVDDHGFDQLLRQRGLDDLANRINQQFIQTIETWPHQPSLFDELQTKEGYRVALSQKNKLERLKYLFHDEAAVELGIAVGFNSTDGD